MAERLIIDNFAGIQHLELDLKKINVLIGPQAAGKSICAKLLYYFKGSIQELFAGSEVPGEPVKGFDQLILGRFHSYFHPSSFSAHDSRVRYQIGDAFMEASRKKGTHSGIKLDYSKSFETQLQLFQKDLSGLGEERTDGEEVGPLLAYRIARSRLRQRVVDELGERAGFSQVFIPAGRSFFAHVQKGTFSLMKSGYTVDPFLQEFGSFYELMHSDPAFGYGHGTPGTSRDIGKAIHSILCGEHLRRKEEDLIQMDDGRVTNIAYASSGQQEMLPLALMLEYLSSGSVARPGYSVCIEEPEAHLFPTAQRSVVELLAMVFNIAPAPLQFTITTHSPYILTVFNNLMQAGALAKTLPKKKMPELDKVVPAAKRLAPDVVAAYVLEAGTGRSIICPDTGLISAEIIDRVSDDLSVQFDELLELE